MRGRPSSASGHQFGAGQAAVAVEARQRAHQRQGLGDRAPSVFRLSVPHSTMAIDSGRRVAVFQVAVQQALGLAGAVATA
jgi:hypothetical protein